MFSRDGLFISAIAAVTIAISAIGSISVIGYAQRYSDQRAQAAGYDTRNAQSELVCADSGTFLSQIGCAFDQMRSQQEQERAKADLNAQQDMSVWAQAMFWATLVAIVVSAGGIVLVYETLRETRNMAAETQKFSKAELRAYVSPIQFLIWGLAPEERIMVAFQIKNFGQTPAHTVHHKYSVHIVSSESPIPKFSENAVVEEARYSLAPGHDFRVDFVTVNTLKPLEVLGLTMGNLKMYVRGYVTYSDGFGKRRYSTFCYVLSVGMPTGPRLVMTKKHNHAN